MARVKEREGVGKKGKERLPFPPPLPLSFFGSRSISRAAKPKIPTTYFHETSKGQ